jgi:hypothetical protein
MEIIILLLFIYLIGILINMYLLSNYSVDKIEELSWKGLAKFFLVSFTSFLFPLYVLIRLLWDYFKFKIWK